MVVVFLLAYFLPFAALPSALGAAAGGAA